MIPFATTAVEHLRWDPANPGARKRLAARAPAVVGSVSGREIAAFRGTSPAEWEETLDAKLNCDLVNLAYNDIIRDIGTDTLYRVQWAMMRQGFGLDHMEAGLSRLILTGTYTLYRGTTVDADGDRVPTGTPLLSGVPGYVMEVSRSVMAPASETPGVVRTLMGRFPPGFHLEERDRLVETATNRTFVVTSGAMVSPGDGADVGVELERVY